MNEISYLTFKESKQHDQYLLNNGFSINELINIAGKQIANWIQTHYENTPLLGIIGKGNNALDVLAAFKQLNHDSRILLYNLFPEIKSTPHYQNLINNKQIQLINSLDDLSKNTVIIDGIFGTGLNRALSPLMKDTISFINNLPNTVISVDVPSGITETNNSNSIRANITLTMMFPKKIMQNKLNRPFFGQTYVLNFHLKHHQLNGYRFPKVIDNAIRIDE